MVRKTKRGNVFKKSVRSSATWHGGSGEEEAETASKRKKEGKKERKQRKKEETDFLN